MTYFEMPRLTREELDEALMPMSDWMALNEEPDAILDALTFTPKPGDRDLLLWIAPGVGLIGMVYLAAHLIVAAVS